MELITINAICLQPVIAVHYNQNAEEARKTLGQLKSNEHFMVQADFSKPDYVKNILSEVENKAGKIDILVNNAGIFYEIDISTISFEDWQNKWNYTINTNLISPVHLSFLAAKSMMKYGYGKIINISSRGAFRGEPNAPYYGASKAGLNSFSQSMAKALAPHNIFVYSIILSSCLGVVAAINKFCRQKTNSLSNRA